MPRLRGTLRPCIGEGIGLSPPSPPHRQLSVVSCQLSVSKNSPFLLNWQLTTPLVGRELELAQLHQWLEKALSGERQLVFVTGEPGIGKTALVETFLARMAAEGETWIGRGQCIEHYGAGEAYLPLLEALGRLCRELEGQHFIELLSQHAPTWLVQMPALLSTAALKRLQQKTQGATRERMLRELTEAVETLTDEKPLVLWLEDLQWSDVSTLDWLAFVARRQERARLLVIGTYRPMDVLAREHPVKAIKQELQLHGRCAELPPDFLTEVHVTEYLTKRFSGGVMPSSSFQRLARLIHQRTDGNPLFMVNMVEHLLSQGILARVDGQWTLKGEEAAAAVPETLRQMIEQRLAQADTTVRLTLEVASIAGAEFSAAAVAAGLGTAIEAVEEQCVKLVRQEQFLRASGTAEWPDGTVAARYSFQHALYQEVLYERLPSGRRQRLHRQIGEREEHAYGERAREIATELALHFERGRDYRRAVQYLEQAGKNAIRRSAHQEVISLLTKALELLKHLSDTPERTQQELTLQITKGVSLAAIKGYSAPETEYAYAQALVLCRQIGNTPQLFPVLQGLQAFHWLRAEHETSRALAEQLLTLAQRAQDPKLLLEAQCLLGQALQYLGELMVARQHLEQGLALYDPQQTDTPTSWVQPIVQGFTSSAHTLWYLGYPEQAVKRTQEALSLAQESAHPFALTAALYWAAEIHLRRREEDAALEKIEACLALAAKRKFTIFLTAGTSQRGIALIEQGRLEQGIGQIREGLAAWQAIGAVTGRQHWLAVLAGAYGQLGQSEAGLALVNEGLEMVQKTGERLDEAALYRLKGQLMLRQSKVPSRRSRSVLPQSA